MDDYHKLTSIWESENDLSVREVNHVSEHQIIPKVKGNESRKSHLLKMQAKATDIKMNGKEFIGLTTENKSSSSCII